MPHIHEKIDFTVEVLIVNNKKVLMRKHDKYKIWLSVGGHVELNEDPNQAAIREVKEEVGLDVTLVNLRPFEVFDYEDRELVPPVGLNRHKISDSHEHVTLIYFARATTDKVIPEKETDEWKWCTLEEIDLLSPIAKDIVSYAKKALELVK